jgi:hypothetical protein
MHKGNQSSTHRTIHTGDNIESISKTGTDMQGSLHPIWKPWCNRRSKYEDKYGLERSQQIMLLGGPPSMTRDNVRIRGVQGVDEQPHRPETATG